MIGVYDLETGDLELIVASLSGVPMNGKGSAERPDLPVTWDAQSRAWVDDVAGERLRKWEAVKVRRDLLLEGACPTGLGPVDCDESSRLNIAGAVQMAVLARAAGQPFTVDWTMADNSVVSHDGAAMIAMGLAVGTFVAGCHAVARGLRDAIAGAASIEAIDGLDIDAAPWPSTGAEA